MTAAFHASFDRWARRVRAAIALRTTLAYATLGAVAAAPVATLSWATRHTSLLHASLALPFGAALVGAAVAWRARWEDPSVALLLDARLGAREAIATALGLDATPADGSAQALVVASATEALARATPAVLPRVLRRAHLALALGLAVPVGLHLVPHKTTISTAVFVGPTAPLLTLERVPGLERVERLRALRATTPAERQRLDALAAQAQRLREQLRLGMPPAQAQEALRQLRQAIEAQRDRLSDPSEQRGLEQAAQRLEQAGFPEAAEALRSHDLTALDQAMEQAANSREAADRQRARQALQDAARMASQAGASATAGAMEQEEQLLRRRETRSSLLRQLAQQLAQDPAVRRAAEHLDRANTDSAAQSLARSLEQALARLTPEERARLAERMQAALRAAQQSSEAGSMDPQHGPQGQQGQQPMSASDLERALREMANSEPQQGGQQGQQGGQQGQQGQQGGGGGGVPFPMLMPGGTPGAAAQQGLQQASDGAAQAQRQASDQSGQGAGQGGQNGSGGQGSGQDGDGEGEQGGPSRGGGPGRHSGHTNAAGGGDMRAQVRGPVHGGSSAPGTLAGTTTGPQGATARTAHTGDLRAVGPEEVRGVDRSDIPTEYRDQVRVYFQP